MEKHFEKTTLISLLILKHSDLKEHLENIYFHRTMKTLFVWKSKYACGNTEAPQYKKIYGNSREFIISQISLHQSSLYTKVSLHVMFHVCISRFQFLVTYQHIRLLLVRRYLNILHFARYMENSSITDNYFCKKWPLL